MYINMYHLKIQNSKIILKKIDKNNEACHHTEFEADLRFFWEGGLLLVIWS